MARGKIGDRSGDSDFMLAYWQQVQDIVTGLRAMTDAGSKYLPMLPGEDKDDYSFRLSLAKMTNVYRDTLEGLSSKPFEEEIKLPDENGAIPEEILKFIEDVDGSGNNLTVFAADVFFNSINSAIDWILVDYQSGNATRTRAEERSLGLKPYWSHIRAINVLDVQSRVIGGNEVLTYFEILEPGSPDKVRVFERTDTGAIEWRLYVKPSGKTDWEIEDSGFITIDVIPAIPMITGRRNGKSFRFYPAMRDAADLQIQLYRNETGLEHIKTLTAYPMVAANGVKPEKDETGQPKKMMVGPQRFLFAPPDGNGNSGSYAILEPSGQSLTFLKDDIAATIQQLRELGRQPLTAQSGQLTTITTRVAAGKAKSAVSMWSNGLKDALENALVITCKWFNIDRATYDPEVRVFNEFDNFDESGKDIDTILAMRATNDLSQETLWAEMGRRRILSPEFTADREKKRILNEVAGGRDPEEDELDENGNPAGTGVQLDN